MATPDELQGITDFRSFVAYLRDELDWEIPEDLPLDKLTYSYTADELGLNLDAQVEITQLRPILGQAQPWGVFFVDFDKAELPVGLLKRILSGVSRKKRASANPGDRALFEKNDLLFVSAFGKAEDRRLALAHFHQEPDTTALPTLRVLAWDRQDTPRHMKTVAERLDRLRWPDGRELTEAWKARWAGAFIDRPREAIRTSKEMATALADCAKQIRGAIQEILPKEKKGQPLTQLFEAVRATLNKDLDVPKFADTYAQTIAYGLLSKRIDQVQRWRAEKARTLNGALPLPPITADALETAIPTNPFLSELLTSFMSAVGRDAGGSALDFDELGLGDLVDLLNTANMEAVLDDFDKDKQGDDPVIHFYEGFLAAYDKAMKVQRGVFYTPKPVVSFIVRSVDEVLRTEFGLPMGLGDTTTWGEFVAAHPDAKVPSGVKPDEPFVKILDPATGTGTFLVEVIDLIHQRMTEEAWKGKPAEEKRRLWNAYVPEHLLPRLYGYELMMAPYAVAHMKIGLKLADTGYDFSGTETGPDGKVRPTRARVFLTNALEPPQDLDMQLAFMNEALAHEAKAANGAKGRARFTVVLGNPPYSSSVTEPLSLMRKLADWKKDLNETKADLNREEWKFLRLAALLIEEAGHGQVGFIVNRDYLDGITKWVMRNALADQFPLGQHIDLNGDVRGTVSDENVFEIMQGVSVCLLSSLGPRDIRYASLTGSAEQKFEALRKRPETVSLQPVSPYFRWLKRKNTGTDDREEYMGYPAVNSAFPVYSSGIQTKNDKATIGFAKVDVWRAVCMIAQQSVEATKAAFPVGKKGGWSASAAKDDLSASGPSEARLAKILYNPLDWRWTYYTGKTGAFHARPRRDVLQHLLRPGNVGLMFNRQIVGEKVSHFGICDSLAAHGTFYLGNKGQDYVAPLWIRQTDGLSFAHANLSPTLVAQLAKLTGLHFDEGWNNPAEESPVLPRERGDLQKAFGARDVFDWVSAVLHSATYRERYSDFLKSDFPRVPLPKDRDLFAALIPLGTKLVALHRLDADALPELLTEPKVRFVSNGGEARLGRLGSDKEVFRDAAGRVYLNAQNWFATVPESAWEHWIGGYQPAQKWLKDRAQTGSKDTLKLGRLLTEEDILHYRRMIVALEETGKVMAKIDRIIDQHGGWPDALRGATD